MEGQGIPTMGHPPLPLETSGTSTTPTIPTMQVLNLSTTSLTERQSHAALLLDLETKKRAATLTDVPTLHNHVRDALRSRGLPVRLFGENNANIRDRLRNSMARELVLREGGVDVQILQPGVIGGEVSGDQFDIQTKGEEEEEDVSTMTTKYTHASEALVRAREFIAEFSLKRSKDRLYRERKLRLGARKRVRLSRLEGADQHVNLRRVHNFKDDYNNVDYDDRESDEYVVMKLENMDNSCRSLYGTIRSKSLEGSQYGDQRALSAIATSRSNSVIDTYSSKAQMFHNIIATGGWSGSIKLWDGNSFDLDLLSTKNIAHEDRIMGIALQPLNTGHVQNSILATASIDLTAKLWALSPNSNYINTEDLEQDSEDNANNEVGKEKFQITEIAHLKGHAARLCNVAFHPSGRYVGTTSFDHTWRLWDVERSGSIGNGDNNNENDKFSSTELLLQDGHWKEAFGIGFHTDGSLVSTTDFGGVVQVWDLRSGKSACHFLGHAKRVLCSEFSPNGFQIASAGDDGTIKIWDLRQRKLYASIPAHSRLITQLKFAHCNDVYNNTIRGESFDQNGEFLASSSFDGTAKVWSTRDWKLLSTMHGHEGKVMGVDVLDGKGGAIVTCGYDKTLKIWK